MARISNYLALTIRQYKLVGSGKMVEIKREGKPFFVSLKENDSETIRLRAELKSIKMRLAKVEKKKGASNGK